jgi:hypothetical protein
VFLSMNFTPAPSKARRVALTLAAVNGVPLLRDLSGLNSWSQSTLQSEDAHGPDGIAAKDDRKNRQASRRAKRRSVKGCQSALVVAARAAVLSVITGGGKWLEITTMPIPSTSTSSSRPSGNSGAAWRAASSLAYSASNRRNRPSTRPGSST